jgi:hypothetical protein
LPRLPRPKAEIEGEAEKAEPEPEAAEEAKAEEPEAEEGEAAPEAEAETAYVEDAENPANDIRRRLWRVKTALEYIPIGMADKVADVLWRIREGNREVGKEIWVKWFVARGGEEEAARKRWGPGGWCGVEELFKVAALAGWRYPLAQNLNRLDEVVKRTEEALVRAKAVVYSSGDRLVRPVRIEVDATKGRKTNIAVLVEIDHAFLKAEITKFVDFFKWDKKDQRMGSGVPPDVVNGLLGRFGKWKFPEVVGVVTTPTMRRDGSVLMTEGWDPETKLILMGPVPAMPQLSLTPSREDAEQAVRMLDQELLSEFPFVDEASKSAALSGLITPNVRAALSCVPAHGVTAREAGTGKSFLCDIVAGIAIGDAMPITAAGKDLEETEKRLNTKILKGSTLFCIDNVSIPIGGDAFCQVVERPTYTLRILGLTKGKDRKNTWTTFVNGNNLVVKDDATRRTLLIRMDAKVEDPKARQFKGNPFDRVLADRGRYIWAALTVVLAYRAAGQPGKLLRFGDPFDEWSDNVRSALVWLGYADPVETMNEARERDPNRQARMSMLWAMFNVYGSEPRLASQMIKDAKAGVIEQKGKKLIDCSSGGAADLKAAIVQYTSERLDAKFLGSKLNKDAGRITDGLVLCQGKYDTHSKIDTWFVSRAEEAG